MEEPVVAATIGCELEIHGRGSCAVTCQYDMARIATKLLDVSLDPLKRLSLVLEPIVDASTGGDFFARQEAVRSNAIVEVDDDNVQVARENQSRTVVIRVTVRVEAAALPDRYQSLEIERCLHRTHLNEEVHWQV